MTAALLLAGLARAGTALDGSTGLVTLPTTDTTPQARIRASLGLGVVRGYAGVGLTGLPIGFAGGLLRGVEVGGHLEQSPVVADPRGPERASVGTYARVRPFESAESPLTVALEGGVDGIGGVLGGALTGIVALDLRRVTLTASSGAGYDLRDRWTHHHGAGAEISAGALAVVVEGAARMRVDGEPLRSVDARAGVRAGVRDRVGVLGWGGGGSLEASPWIGGGVALQLSSADPRRQDTDRDQVPDWTDLCRGSAEDRDGFADDDGCPERDNDEDGILDAADPTPNGEPPAEPLDLPGETPTLKMRIKPRPMPGPVDPAKRGTGGSR